MGEDVEERVEALAPLVGAAAAQADEDALHRRLRPIEALRRRLTFQRRLLETLNRAAEEDAEAVLQLLAALLEKHGGGMPEVEGYYAPLRADADWWAACCAAPVLEAYGFAALRHLPDQVLADRMRKRLLVALWSDLGESDRRAFLLRVDPAGRFRGAA